MAIARPITKTIISTTAWGVPITDAVNASSAALAALVPTPWTAFTLVNGWTNWGGVVPPAAYSKIGDVVYIRGGIKGPGTAGVITSALPVGFRPVYQIDLPGLFYSGTRQVVNISVNLDGTLSAADAVPNTALVTINNIIFRAG